MSQPGQDAKFFTRGKIEVRPIRITPSQLATTYILFTCRLGISCRFTSSRNERQEVREEENCSQEDRRKYHYGQ